MQAFLRLSGRAEADIAAMATEAAGAGLSGAVAVSVAAPDGFGLRLVDKIAWMRVSQPVASAIAEAWSEGLQLPTEADLEFVRRIEQETKRAAADSGR